MHAHARAHRHACSHAHIWTHAQMHTCTHSRVPTLKYWNDTIVVLDVTQGILVREVCHFQRPLCQRCVCVCVCVGVCSLDSYVQWCSCCFFSIWLVFCVSKIKCRLWRALVEIWVQLKITLGMIFTICNQYHFHNHYLFHVHVHRWGCCWYCGRPLRLVYVVGSEVLTWVPGTSQGKGCCFVSCFFRERNLSSRFDSRSFVANIRNSNNIGESKSSTHRKICLLSPLLFELRILATKLLETNKKRRNSETDMFTLTHVSKSTEICVCRSRPHACTL